MWVSQGIWIDFLLRNGFVGNNKVILGSDVCLVRVCRGMRDGAGGSMGGSTMESW